MKIYSKKIFEFDTRDADSRKSREDELSKESDDKSAAIKDIRQKLRDYLAMRRDGLMKYNKETREGVKQFNDKLRDVRNS